MGKVMALLIQKIRELEPVHPVAKELVRVKVTDLAKVKVRVKERVALVLVPDLDLDQVRGQVLALAIVIYYPFLIVSVAMVK